MLSFILSYYPTFIGTTISKFTPGGVGSVFASSGLSFPYGLAFDSAGNLYAAIDTPTNTIEMFTPGGAGSVFVSTGVTRPSGLAFDPAGNLYMSSYAANTITKYTPGGVGSVFASTGLSGPAGIAFDSAGNLFVANFDNSTIRQFSSTGTDLGVFADSSDGLKPTNISRLRPRAHHRPAAARLRSDAPAAPPPRGGRLVRSVTDLGGGPRAVVAAARVRSRPAPRPRRPIAHHPPPQPRAGEAVWRCAHALAA